MATVILSWEDPEHAAEFADIAARLRRLGWLPDPEADALRELVRLSAVVQDGGGEETRRGR